jgi:hypothetical protein
MAQIILYGIAGASKQYMPIRYQVIELENYTTWYAKYYAKMMVAENPTVEHVYQMDNRRGLKREFIQAQKLGTIESCAIFKDTLEREGIKLI